MFYVVVAGSMDDSVPLIETTAIFTDVNQASEYEAELIESGDYKWVDGGMCESIES